MKNSSSRYTANAILNSSFLLCSQPAWLQDKRDNSFNAFRIGRVLIGELFAHHFFFAAEFDPEAYEHEDESDYSRDVSLFDRRGDEHGKYAGVNGMTDKAIGSAHNQFVVFFQGHRAAPVAAENGAGPETEAKSA